MPAPIITSKENASAFVNQSFKYQIEAEYDATTYSASGLPNGLNLNVKSGFISGNPTDVGSATVVLNASNAFGTGTSKLYIITHAAPTSMPVTNIQNSDTVYTKIPVSTSAVSFSTLNGHRVGLYIYNNSNSAVLYCLIGGIASTTSWSFKLPPNAYYEMPVGYYSDLLTGVWDTADANGFAMVTEVSNSQLNIFNSGKFPY